MVPVLKAVPNLSAGRNHALVDRLVRVASRLGAEVLDASADPDHNRTVLTFVGPPEAVEDASVEIARIAVEEIDLRQHEGVHPRVGALDVLPFVPLAGLTMEEAQASAWRVGDRLAREVGLPVFFYSEASQPPGKSLASLRTGGFESLVRGFPSDRVPDILPESWPHPGVHPTAGVTCVGARPLLLAWNVEVEGLTEEEVRRLAAELRERDGGTVGLRALAMTLASKGSLQVSMNLEDVCNRKPFLVFQDVENRVRAVGGRVVNTEVLGLVPDELILEAGVDRLSLLDPYPSRVLSAQLTAHVVRRAARQADELLALVRESGDLIPQEFHQAVEQLGSSLAGFKSWNER